MHRSSRSIPPRPIPAARRATSCCSRPPGTIAATLSHPQWRLGQVAFIDDTRAVVVDSSGRLLVADAEQKEWLDVDEVEEQERVAGQHGFEVLPLAVSEDGASLWCDPQRWVPEAHRLLRPGGQLVFFVNGALLMACTPADGGVAETELVRDYFSMCADVFGVREHIRFGTEVLGAAWDEERACWNVRTRAAGGEETVAVQVLVSASGQLNRPLYPDIPGRDGRPPRGSADGPLPPRRGRGGGRCWGGGGCRQRSRAGRRVWRVLKGRRSSRRRCVAS